MGHTGSYAFGDYVRRNLGATVVELGIPPHLCVGSVNEINIAFARSRTALLVNFQDNIAHGHGHAVGESFYAQEASVVAHLFQNKFFDFGKATDSENFRVPVLRLVSGKQMSRHEFYPAPVLIVIRGKFFELINRGVDCARVGKLVLQVLNVQFVINVETHLDVDNAQDGLTETSKLR